MNISNSKNRTYQKHFKNRVVGLLITFVTTFTASSWANSDSEGNGGTLLDNTSFTTTALPELISSEDSSVLRNAFANGQDLTRSLLSTNFHCYAKVLNNYSTPTLSISIDGSDFNIITNHKNNIPGHWEHLDENIFRLHSSGDFANIRLDLTAYGQVMNWVNDGDQASFDSCYQEGAGHEFALLRYEMRDPDTGDYQCRTADTGASIGTLDLQTDGKYSINSHSGVYKVKDIISADIESEPSTIYFLNGPLADSTASYLEYPGSGYQELFFKETTKTSSWGGAALSSSAQMICSRSGEPKVFKTYGSAPATEPASPGTSLSGLYAINAGVHDSDNITNTIEFADFRANGYVYTGVPFEGGADCSLTNPAGLSYCSTYQYDGRTLVIDSPSEMPVEYVTQSSSGVLTQWDEFPIERVTAINRDAILGDWQYKQIETGGLAMCIVGFCSSSKFLDNITFHSDGTFSNNSEGSDYNLTRLVHIASSSRAKNSSSLTGAFTLSGNLLTMEYSNGHSITELVHFGFDNTILAIGDRGYRRQ